MCTYSAIREGGGGGATKLGRSEVYIDDTGRERCMGGHLSALWPSATHSQATIEQGGWSVLYQFKEEKEKEDRLPLPSPTATAAAAAVVVR